eukprot:6965891-Pyramimonas_sp.AAC.1
MKVSRPRAPQSARCDESVTLPYSDSAVLIRLSLSSSAAGGGADGPRGGGGGAQGAAGGGGGRCGRGGGEPGAGAE